MYIVVKAIKNNGMNVIGKFLCFDDAIRKMKEDVIADVNKAYKKAGLLALIYEKYSIHFLPFLRFHHEACLVLGKRTGHSWYSDGAHTQGLQLLTL